MSPEFKKSVAMFAGAVLEVEFAKAGALRSGDVHLLSGLVYRFIESLAEEAYEVSKIKGNFDAECFTFACRNNLKMYKRMTRLLAADRAVKEACAVHL